MLTGQFRPGTVTAMLFVQGIMGALQRLLARIPRDMRYRIISLCGFICLVTPLALWISMTIWGFQMILTVWFASMIILSLMIWSSPDERI
ncbi:MAG: hypothetical protein ACI9XZ_000509 [Alphaproteobacteria bacterium]